MPETGYSGHCRGYIMAGVISYTLINLIAGKTEKVHWIMYVLTVVFIAKYALI